MSETTPRERAEHHLAQALTRAEGDAREHIRAALDEMAGEPLTACAECGRKGLEGRFVCTYCAD